MTHTEEEKTNVPVEAQTGVMWPQTKECRQLPEAGKGKDMNSPQNLRRERDPADTWVSAHSRQLTSKTVKA